MASHSSSQQRNRSSARGSAAKKKRSLPADGALAQERILESITDAFFALDSNWCFTYVNREGERVLQRSREELLGRNVWAEFPDAVHTEVYEVYQRVAAEKTTASFEYYYPALQHWFDVRAYPAEDGISVFFRDITRRKQAEAALRESEERQTLALQAARVTYWTWHIQTNHVEFSGDSRTLFGCSVDSIQTFEQFLEIVHPADRAALQARVDESLRSGNPYLAEFRVVHPDGSIRWLVGKGDCTRNAAGEPEALRGVNFDVSERKAIESALEEERERFRTLADNIAQLAWMAHASGEIFWYNQRWFDYTGTTLDEVSGWGWQKAHHPDHLARVMEKFRRCVETGEVWEDIFPLRGRDGKYRWFLSRAVPIRDGAGRVFRWFGTNTDVTDRKEAEAERERLLDDLRQNAKRKDEFLAMLAHELRNPLGAVQNAATVLGLSERSEDRKWATSVINRQVIQLTGIVSDLLDVARINTGKIRLEKTPLNLAEVLDRAVESASPMMEQRHHTLTTSYDRSGALRIDADASRMEQVILNLLTNAAKYTEPGGRISLEAWRSGSEAVVRVKDNGVGIPPERLPAMFELFVQGERSLARSEGGLGLGLTIVQRLTEMHGGVVSAHSEGVGKGSEFVLRFPMAAPEDRSGSVAEIQPPASKAREARVLVVEDNVDAALGMARLLRLFGHTVEVTHDGISAVSLAQSFRPDVVLLDIGLPGMNGYEVATRLREEPCCRGGLLIATSGYGQKEDRQRSVEAGFDHHLVKPVDIDELKKLLAHRRTD